MTPILGFIMPFAGNFAPYGWALCNGQLISIANYSALYALLGTTHGGDGQTTFGLPNLQGRVPIGYGQGPGQPNYVFGQIGGTESVTLTANNLPAHTHSASLTLNAVNTAGNTTVPTGNYLAASRAATSAGFATTGTTVAMNSGSLSLGSLGATGNVSPTAVSILQPSLAITYIIALEGIFPSRN